MMYAVRAQRPLAPVTNENSRDAIPGQYIVVFKPGTSRSIVAAAQERIKGLGGIVLFTYTRALIGFGAKLPANALQAVRANSSVAYVEVNQKYKFDTIQPNPPTGLDRTSERLLALDNKYTYSETGAGVHVYVIDSGIWIAHTDFGGRASSDFSAAGTSPADLTDCLGHGTHVAGTIGGTTFGIAKQVTLHSVRVGDAVCAPTTINIVAGVDWVTNNRNPAVANVANMSLGGPASAAIDTAVNNSITLGGVTYVVAAGNNTGLDACTRSPARVPAAITVGATDPSNDTRPAFSNIGACLDLFAPGVQIESAMPDGLAAIPGCTIVSTTAGSRTQRCSGTSMSSPHVAGVAARYLENHAAATPAAVWGAIHNADDVSTTVGWPGIISPGAGSPNELLHWGSLNDGFDDGEPHITTIDGIRYDFQSAGEFVTLRDAGGLEIQTRQTPAATTFTIASSYTGLASCVSINTAVAARVGEHRVTYQPSLSGVVDPSGLQLRVDGVLTPLAPGGLNLGPGARVMPSGGGGIQIDFPDGTSLVVNPGFWPPLGRWYLNLSVFHTSASEGIMGPLAPGSWLPALPNGASMGPMSASLHQRFLDLTRTFADAWRVTNKTSLFDYAPGTSTANFTIKTWPHESLPCELPEQPPVKPLEPQTARELCRAITGKDMNADCVFDVTVTGEAGFAKTYLTTQRIRTGSTTVTVNDDKNPTKVGERVTFTATVDRNVFGGKGAPTGAVQFMLDGFRVGAPVKLDSDGRASWTTSALKSGQHQVSATYLPGERSAFLPGTSLDKPHTVGDGKY